MIVFSLHATLFQQQSADGLKTHKQIALKRKWRRRRRDSDHTLVPHSPRPRRSESKTGNSRSVSLDASSQLWRETKESSVIHKTSSLVWLFSALLVNTMHFYLLVYIFLVACIVVLQCFYFEKLIIIIIIVYNIYCEWWRVETMRSIWQQPMGVHVVDVTWSASWCFRTD